MRKWAAAVGSATPDPEKGTGAVQAVPPPVVANKPAPGQRGPKGLAPRTTYSRVNTGAPPTPDAGASSQKTMPPRGMEFLPAKVAEMSDQMMTRVPLQELVKQAMAGTISKVDLSVEAQRQFINQGEEEKTANASVPSEYVPTEHLTKLADVVDYIADHMEKEADQGNVQKPGEGPGALSVLEAQSSEQNIDAGQLGQATGANQPPKNPPTQGEQVQGGKANTGLESNDDMKHDEQPTDPVSNEKGKIGPSGGDKTVTAEALAQKNLERLMKVGQEKPVVVSMAKEAIIGPAVDVLNLGIPSAIGYQIGHGSGFREGLSGMPRDKASLAAGAVVPGYIGYRIGKGKGRTAGSSLRDDKDKEKKASQSEKPVNPTVALVRKLAAQTKKAEDANNPAQISAGSSSSAAPAASASEQAVPPQPSDVNKQTSMVSSNESAINYKKREAKADSKSDVAKLLREPPQSKSTDKTLSTVLDNTESAGAKISSASGSAAEGVMKTAAARALLSKLAENANSKKNGKKDEKDKQSMLEASPQGHSGFSAGQMNPMSY